MRTRKGPTWPVSWTRSSWRRLSGWRTRAAAAPRAPRRGRGVRDSRRPGAGSPPRKGRGATVNPPNRFERQQAAPFDDGWSTLAADIAELPPLPTTLIRDSSRSVIAWNAPPTSASTAPSIRTGAASTVASTATRGRRTPLSATRLASISNQTGVQARRGRSCWRRSCASPLRRPHAGAGLQHRPLPAVERTLKLTRAVLQVLDRFNHPVSIVTKSAGVLRDLDILQSLRGATLVCGTCR